ncbi:hypothetical protein WN50_39515 [Limnoraphis robusta CS-951]|uniref:Uncharacterized protein n=1 Tax=Limnoraphis robusta CS-951 TaxID=1637645 RepID=A0A0J9HL11_9CYAN|nr:hypothetical protein WN50_39515 [Limnoraphis robusta CS-951]
MITYRSTSLTPLPKILLFLITFSNQLQINSFKIQKLVKNDYIFIANSSQEFDSRIGVLVE